MGDKPPSEAAPPVPEEERPSRNPIRRLYNWTVSWADRPNSGRALFLLSVAEASFFPIPPDFLLIPLVFGAPQKAWRLAGLTLLGSLIGAVIGYGIGLFLWEATKEFWFSWVFSEEKFEAFQKLAQGEWGILAVFAGAFSPIPFKVVTICSGAVSLSFPLFLLISLVGRGGRFFLVAAVARWIGPKARPFIEKHLNWLALLMVVLLVAGFWALSVL